MSSPLLGIGRANPATVGVAVQKLTAPAAEAAPTPAVEEAVEEVAEVEPAARWSSHPIQRYTVGDYQFENGLLVLRTDADAEAFQAVYDQLPIYEQTRLKKIDLSAAEALVRERLHTGGGATKGIDSATGDRAPNNQVGAGDLIQGQ